jgi:hypothetical protein
MPCPEGPVFHLRKRVFPSISAWPGSPPRRLRFRRSSGRSAHLPPSGNAKRASPDARCLRRTISFSVASVA